jgi:hypothetical protein
VAHTRCATAGARGSWATAWQIDVILGAVMRTRLIRNLVLTASCLAATVVPAQSAFAQTQSLEFVGGALLAKGAAVRITFTYTCTPNPFGSSSERFEVTQRAGSSVATGSNFASTQGGGALTCDDMQHTGQVDVAAQDNRFKKGPAFVSAIGDIANSRNFTGTIQIK